MLQMLGILKKVLLDKVLVEGSKRREIWMTVVCLIAARLMINYRSKTTTADIIDVLYLMGSILFFGSIYFLLFFVFKAFDTTISLNSMQKCIQEIKERNKIFSDVTIGEPLWYEDIDKIKNSLGINALPESYERFLKELGTMSYSNGYRTNIILGRECLAETIYLREKIDLPIYLVLVGRIDNNDYYLDLRGSMWYGECSVENWDGATMQSSHHHEYFSKFFVKVYEKFLKARYSEYRSMM